MRITTGPPVRGDDFFNRERDLARLWERSERHHVLLLSPRRVGKTSLLHRMCRDASGRGIRAVYLSTEALHQEADLVDKLFETLAQHPEAKPVLQAQRGRAAQRQLRRVSSVGPVGVEPMPTESWHEDARRFSSALRSLTGRWLIVVDELPLLVLKLVKADPTGSRAQAFLEWLRSLRQGEPDRAQNVYWILAGSIGLDTVTRRMHLSHTINDLAIEPLGPFEPESADALLRALAESYSLPLADAVRERISTRVSWLIPYYLQLFFHTIHASCHELSRAPGLADVDQAFEDLLAPANRAYFDHWDERLDDELGALEAGQARLMLAACAAAPEGAARSTLGAQLSDFGAAGQARDRTLAFLLEALVADGYLVEVDGRLRFRSELLREWWLRSFTA